MLDPVERVLAENTSAPHREMMRRIFANYPPYEALALLGYLITETVMRFPTDEHDRILRWANLDTFCDELQAPPDA